jgi:hypothetical protein
MGRPQVFGLGVSVGVLAGFLIGSLITLWLGEAAVELAHRLIDRLAAGRRRRQQTNFPLLLQ